MEIWKDIKGYEGYYQISNIGRVKSLSHSILRKNNCKQTFKERILKDRYKQNRGLLTYKIVDLTINNIKKTFHIHRLVAIHFIPNPENKLEINHINGIKDDNRLENLEWSTMLENHEHAFANGLVKNPRKKTIQYDDNKNVICRYNSRAEVANKYNIVSSRITIAIKKNYRAIGFYWGDA